MPTFEEFSRLPDTQKLNEIHKLLLSVFKLLPSAHEQRQGANAITQITKTLRTIQLKIK